MSTSYINVKDLGQVKLFRRRGLKNIRLSIDSTGEIRLSVPWYVPKAAGIRYLNSRRDWISQHRKTTGNQWINGQDLTNGYRLFIASHQKTKTRSILDQEILRIYVNEKNDDDKNKRSIDTHVKKFLKKEAEKTLIPLAIKLSEQTGFQPKSIRIKNLKSRWGSCNQDKVITLNVSLLKLPNELIEYVIFHELVHTRHLNHSKRFWDEVEAVLPDYKQRRKALKTINSVGIF
ncbi:MAG: SprT family zinc-dependent metalloprotease [Candidatus Saccharimonadales bacterium]